jgi:alanyl-tRNA synthetase
LDPGSRIASFEVTMTFRIYYTDPSCVMFEATVSRTLMHEDRPAVILDRTAFYPTSGGQPFDTGRLGLVDVVEVVDTGDDVVHLLSAPLAAGARVVGEIDWARRLDHMQQHTGQHILSAAFAARFDNATVSFHMGAEISTIDLAKPASADEIAAAVREANQIVWEDRAVSVRFVSEAEAARLPLRKEPARGGQLRLIEVDCYDVSACGGTHVTRTGTIGLIGVLGSEKLRGGTRITFVCGGRALRSLETYRDAVTGCVRTLSVLPPELPSAVERLQAESKDLRKAASRLQERLASFEAERLVSGATAAGDLRLVMSSLEGWDTPGLKVLAAAAARHDRVLVVLTSSTSPVSIVIARGPGVEIDAGRLLKALTERFGGRGGGKPELAQGGGLDAAPGDVLTAARDLIAQSG